jgi:DNA-binding NarL/FixJ family response regulator
MITSTAPLKNIVYFNTDHSQSKGCTEKLSSEARCTYTLPSTWAELTNSIEHGEQYIAFHINMIKNANVSIAEFIDAITNITKFMHGVVLKIGVVITDQTPLKDIKDLQKTVVTGLLLDINCYSVEDAAIATAELLEDRPYWPKYIIEKLPGNTVKKRKVSDNEIRLTERQQDIFNLVARRGLSNKKIAQILNITESTVKVHVSAILKAYRVRNRTQLALSASPQGLRP